MSPTVRRPTLDFSISQAFMKGRATMGNSRTLILCVILLGAVTLLALRQTCGCGSSHLAKIAAARADIGIMRAQFNAFRADYDRYPTMAEGLAALVNPPTRSNTPVPKQYLDKMPVDPWGHPYIYQIPARNPAHAFGWDTRNSG